MNNESTPVLADRNQAAAELRAAVDGDRRMIIFRRSRRIGSAGIAAAFALTGLPETIAAAGGVSDPTGVMLVLSIFWLSFSLMLLPVEWVFRARVTREHAEILRQDTSKPLRT